MTSSTVQPWPWARTREVGAPGAPVWARQANACSNSIAIFAKSGSLVVPYNGSTMTFQDLLAASGRAPEIPEAADVYGWLTGSWDLDVHHYAGMKVDLKGEAHFAWVLEGRAVQDVWIMPRDRGLVGDVAYLGKNMFGTTLRVWDASIQAWRISWVNPVSMHREEQIGRRSGADVMQVGCRYDGTPTRWSFTEITADSFHWLGEALQADGKTWRLEGEFRARRRG